ncbi:MAG: hypothetical protein J6X19_00530, partial [Clostridia bacterium]|nr:hypothetical protein [Clostridia bacterium]
FYLQNLTLRFEHGGGKFGLLFKKRRSIMHRVLPCFVLMAGGAVRSAHGKKETDWLEANS